MSTIGSESTACLLAQILFILPFSFSISPTKPDIRIPATIWQLVALNMASLGFYFPHNVATWAHFF
jgi:hypothetical protein